MKFYVSKCAMSVSNLQTAIEYPRGEPLKDFVKNISDKRKEATRMTKAGHSEGEIMQRVYKDISNSAWVCSNIF